MTLINILFIVFFILIILCLAICSTFIKIEKDNERLVSSIEEYLKKDGESVK